MIRRPPRSTLFPSRRSSDLCESSDRRVPTPRSLGRAATCRAPRADAMSRPPVVDPDRRERSEEHTSELQSRFDLVCRLLLEKKKKKTKGQLSKISEKHTSKS